MKTTILVVSMLAAFIHSCNSRVQSSKKPLSANDTSVSSTTETPERLEIDGVWTLREFGESKINLKVLYPSKLPFLKINEAAQQINGNTSCNSFSGKIILKENKIKLEEPMAMTQRFCAGEGEAIFLGHLQRVNNLKLTGDSLLHFFSGDTLLMKFTKSTVSP